MLAPRKSKSAGIICMNTSRCSRTAERMGSGTTLTSGCAPPAISASSASSPPGWATLGKRWAKSSKTSGWPLWPLSARAMSRLRRSPGAGMPKVRRNTAELPPESKGVMTWALFLVRRTRRRDRSRRAVPPLKKRMRGPSSGAGGVCRGCMLMTCAPCFWPFAGLLAGRSHRAANIVCKLE